MDGDMLISVDIATRRVQKLLRHVGLATSTKYVLSPDKKIFIAEVNKKIIVWHNEDKKSDFCIEIGEDNNVVQIAFAPQSDRFAIIDRTNKIREFDVASGDLLHSYYIYTSEIKHCEYSRSLIISTERINVSIWDTEHKKCRLTITSSTSEGFCFSKDETYLYAGQDVYLIPPTMLIKGHYILSKITKTKESVLMQMKYKSLVNHIRDYVDRRDAISAINKLEDLRDEVGDTKPSEFYSIQRDVLKLGDMDMVLGLSPIRYISKHGEKGRFCIDNNERFLLTIDGDENPVLYDLKTYDQLFKFGDIDNVSSIDLAKDGTMMIIGNDKEIELWDIANKKKVSTKTHLQNLSAIAFSPYDEYYYTAHCEILEHGDIDPNAAQRIIVNNNMSMEEKDRAFRALFEKDKSLVTIVKWSMKNNQELLKWHIDPLQFNRLRSIYFSNDCNCILIEMSNVYESTFLFHPEMNAVFKILGSHGISVNNDSKYVLAIRSSGGNQLLQIEDLYEEKAIRAFENPELLECSCFSSDGEKIAGYANNKPISGSKEKASVICIWDTKTGKKRWSTL